MANQCREQRGVLCLGFGESLELPGAVIDIAEIVAGFRGNAGGSRDRCGGRDAAAHRTGIDVDGPPVRGDALRQRCGLCHSAPGKLQRLAPAEPLRLDAFDMTVPGQDDLGHRGFCQVRCIT